MNTHSLVSIEDYSKEEILEVLKLASEFEANPNQRLLEGKVVASLFFEPSTDRKSTRLNPYPVEFRDCDQPFGGAYYRFYRCFFFECHQGRDSEGYDQDGR